MIISILQDYTVFCVDVSPNMDQLDRNGASHLSTSLKVMNLLVQQKVWSLCSHVNENWKIFIVLDVEDHLFGNMLE